MQHKKTALRRFNSTRFRYLLFSASLATSALLRGSPAQAQFFTQGEQYAQQILPEATDIITLLVGVLRVAIIMLVGARALPVLKSRDKSEEIGGLFLEIGIVVGVILVIDLILLLIIP